MAVRDTSGLYYMYSNWLDCIVLSWLFHTCHRDTSCTSCNLSGCLDWFINFPPHVHRFQINRKKGMWLCWWRGLLSRFLTKATGNGQNKECRGQVFLCFMKPIFNVEKEKPDVKREHKSMFIPECGSRYHWIKCQVCTCSQNKWT